MNLAVIRRHRAVFANVPIMSSLLHHAVDGDTVKLLIEAAGFYSISIKTMSSCHSKLFLHIV